MHLNSNTKRTESLPMVSFLSETNSTCAGNVSATTAAEVLCSIVSPFSGCIPVILPIQKTANVYTASTTTRTTSLLFLGDCSLFFESVIYLNFFCIDYFYHNV